ncbi:unnamed protein product [Tuber aestivum]|uniref:T6SS Phospholipase effector Tle1-like catalytic domain-containing protein n=1 Tax=Tuber aestivum TaxID=59557 RepID=A0A292Q303_9PEZI|nr:unnamed protein product [Tuber aestivum]
MHKRKKLILCFDGTGNKFKGNDGDTNILKIFRMLDRSGNDQCMSTSFDQHVIGGYKFLMRFYAPGDDIYLFGFSRGAYTARFLAEMLDHVGLVSQGNEEMDGVGWGARKQDMYNYMRAFRETFARPRSAGFPYTARSTALVIRHAVGIDERRAKFRQDLVEKVDIKEMARRRSFRTEHLIKSALGHRLASKSNKNNNKSSHPCQNGDSANAGSKLQRFSGSREALSITGNGGDGGSLMSLNIHIESDSDDGNEKAEQDIEEVWFPGAHGDIGGGWDLPDGEEPLSHGPLVWMVHEARKAGVVFDKERMKQMNVWLDEFETEERDPKVPEAPINPVTSGDGIPKIEVSSTSSSADNLMQTPQQQQQQQQQSANLTPTPTNGIHSNTRTPTPDSTSPKAAEPKTYLLNSYTRGKIHDCLCYPSGGLSLAGTLGWKLMEYLPFRRMDLQPDGSWKPIIWPLPCGEVRDIPETVKIHNSVIRRMRADERYRPGNLIIGGGGRGVRRAPEKAGIGEWEVLREEGSLVGEVLVKKKAAEGLVEKGLVETP